MAKAKKCEFCENEATVFYTQAIDGGQKKVSLCESCADAKGLTDPGSFSMVDILTDAVPEQAPTPASYEVEDECEHCGFTIEDYRKIGRLGCSECYKAFRAEILPVLEKMHHGAEHEGKVPHGLADSLALTKKIDALKARQKKAIADEDFESAARLRDELKELEG